MILGSNTFGSTKFRNRIRSGSTTKTIRAMANIATFHQSHCSDFVMFRPKKSKNAMGPTMRNAATKHATTFARSDTGLMGSSKSRSKSMSMQRR